MSDATIAKPPPSTAVLENFVGGAWLPALAEESIEDRDPATAELIGRVPLCGEADVDVAVAAARTALPAWASREVRSQLAPSRSLTGPSVARRATGHPMQSRRRETASIQLPSIYWKAENVLAGRQVVNCVYSVLDDVVQPPPDGTRRCRAGDERLRRRRPEIDRSKELVHHGEVGRRTAADDALLMARVQPGQNGLGTGL